MKVKEGSKESFQAPILSCATAILPPAIRHRSPRNFTISVLAIHGLFILLRMLLVALDCILFPFTPQRPRILAIVFVLALHVVDFEWLSDNRPRRVEDHLRVATDLCARCGILLVLAAGGYAAIGFVEELSVPV
jgi:hypothetical protein